MKKKVFFLLTSLCAGGSERVFWLLSQGFDKEAYDVALVLLDPGNTFLSRELENVRVIDLNTVRASRSFLSLYRLIRKERPYAVFSTDTHLNLLVAIVSCFIKIPFIAARESSINAQIIGFSPRRAKYLNLLVNRFYKRFNRIVCQSEDMRCFFQKSFAVDPDKLKVIPNPVRTPQYLRLPTANQPVKNIIIVARLSPEKGHKRLLSLFAELPRHYHLTIAGDGIMRAEMEGQIKLLQLENRVAMAGQVSNPSELVAGHDLLVLTSYTEGFPNVILEALAVGTPVVTFRVGGVAELIKPGFNGYVVEQDDSEGFKQAVIRACAQYWDAKAVSRDACDRFSINAIVNAYQELIV